jgi:hypothetical protein
MYSSLSTITSNETNSAVYFSADQYLTHYWPFCNDETMKDLIGTAHMTQGNLTTFIEDRFGNKNSALALNGGWTQIPPGVYFDTPEFSISVWVWPQQINDYSRIIDFGNGEYLDNLVFSLSQSASLNPYLDIYNGSTLEIRAVSNQCLTLGQWEFFTATFNDTNACIYLNGQLTANSYQRFNLTKITRANFYVGKSNWASDGFSWSYFDDLKFFNISLTQEQILDLMNQNQSSKRFLILRKRA